MSGRFKIEIDGIDFSSSVGDMMEMTITKTRTKFIRGLFTSFTSDLTFTNEAYQYIKDYRENISYREVLDVVIYENTTGNFVELMVGKLIIADLKWNITREFTTGKVTDNVWGSKIQNGKKMKFNLDVGRSRNDVPIDVCTSYSTMLFWPDDCADYEVRTLFEVHDAFRFIVHAITDGEVNFISDFLTGQGNFTDTDYQVAGDIWTLIRPYIVRGYHLRDDNQDPAPNVSFEDLYLAFNAYCNLSIQIEPDATATSGQRIRMENTEYFFETDSAITLENIQDLEFGVDSGQLYGSMKVGNQDYLLTGGHDNTRRLRTFREETYLFQGNCNSDRELDITSRFISDSNKLFSMTTETEEQWDERVFIVTAGVVGAVREAVNFTETVPFTDCYYNNNFQNEYVVAQWENSLPYNLTFYVGSVDNFKASVLNPPLGYIERTVTSISPPQTFRVGFDDENYDSGNNYDNTAPNYYYECPLLASKYGFKTRLKFIGATTGDQVIRVTVRMQVRNSLNVIIQEKTKETVVGLSGDGPFNLDYIDSFDIPAVPAVQRVNIEVTLDRVEVDSDVIVTVQDNSFFQCLFNATDGGVYQVGNPNDYRVRQYDFDSAFTMAQWRTVDTSQTQLMTINPTEGAANQATGWIEKIIFTPETGKAKIKLIT